MEKQTPIRSYTAAGAAMMQKMADDPELFLQYLRFQGRVFKQPVNAALEFFSQNPDSQFIASRSAWQQLGYTIRQGSEEQHFLDESGRNTTFYELSQTEEGQRPPMWIVTNQNVPAVKRFLGIAADQQLIAGSLRLYLNRELMTSCIRTLHIPPSKAMAFSRSFANAVQQVLVGRLEAGGGKFILPHDSVALQMLQTDDERFAYLTYVSAAARGILLKIENAVTSVNTVERMKSDDLRSVDEVERGGAGERTGQRSAGDPARDAGEQADQGGLQAYGRRAGLGDNTDSTERIKHEMVSDVPDEAGAGAGVLVQVQPDLRTVRSESDRGRADLGGGTDREVRDAVDGIHERTASASGGDDETAKSVSDGGTVGGEIRLGVPGNSGEGLSEDESPSTDGQLRGTTAVQQGNGLLHGQHSDAGESADSSDKTITEKLNSVFSAPAETEKALSEQDTESAFVVPSVESDEKVDTYINLEINGLTDEEQLVQLTHEITQGKEELAALVEQEHFAEAAVCAEELAALTKRAEEVKARIQEKPLTIEDVRELRSIEPRRKSVHNLLEHEVAQIPKFEKLLSGELGKKSPFELRRGNDSWKEDESKTVPVIEIQSRDISQVQQDRKNGTLKRGNFVNADTQFTINFGTVGIQDTLNHAIFMAKRHTPINARLSALYQAQELIENAICFDSKISQAEKKKTPDTLFMHKMYCVCRFNDEYYLSILSVEESAKRDRDNLIQSTSSRLYNLKDIKITPIQPKEGFQSLGILSQDSRAKLIGATNISIPQLYELVKTYDKNFFENPNSPGREAREAELVADAAYQDAVETLQTGETVTEHSDKQIGELAKNHALDPEKPEQLLQQLKTEQSRSGDQVFGNTKFRFIPQKSYTKAKLEHKDQICEKLLERGIRFSGVIKGDEVTFTTSRKDKAVIKDIIAEITADPDANNDENDNSMPGGSGNTPDHNNGGGAAPSESPDPDVSTPESGEQPDQSSMSGKVDTYINFSSIEPDSLSFHFGNGKDKWFTESDLLHDFVQENPDHSFALGNAILQYLDEKQHSERNIPELKAGWYKKTDFSITAVINGEGFHYDGRFDIGDGKGTGGGSLIDHIRAYNEGILGYTQHPFNQQEYKERAQRTLDIFVPFLEAHSELTAEEQRIFEDFKAENPIRTYDDVEKAQGTFKIYQLPSDEKYHGIRFEGREQLEKDGVQLDHEDYELVYEGVVGEFRGNATLESIYTQFNANHPEDFRGHSLSVSDVVVIDIDGEQTAYYCDITGFVEMPEFFREKEIVQEKAVVSDEQEVSPLGTKDNGVSEEHEDPIGAADELRKIYHDGKTAFYCFPGQERQLNLNTLPLITEKSEQYLIAAGSCLLSDEFMQEHNITFLKYGRDLAYQEDTDHMLQAMRDAASRVNERFTKLSEEDKQFIESYPNAFISEPYDTPWGAVQSCHEIAKGVFEVSTAGHGGIMIREELAEHMLSPEALKIGFVENGYHCYEEDADAQVPLRELFDKGIVDIQQYVSEKYVRSYEEIGEWLNNTINDSISVCHPDYWTAHENAEKSMETPTSSRPTITCEWSESDVFEDGKTYNVAEFDRLMKEADKKRHDGWQKGLATYGSDEAWREQDEEGYFQYLGYDKTKFTVNMPDGTSITERQDIGDGYGGVIDFLRRFGYEQAADVLENDIVTHPTELPVSEKATPQEQTEKSFAEQVDEVLAGRYSRYSDLKVCDTPDILLQVGCEQLPMMYTTNHLRDALKPKSDTNPHFHGLTVEQIKDVPNQLAAPAMIFDSISPHQRGKDSIIAVLNKLDNDNAPIIVSIVPNGSGKYELEKVDSNFITSIYGKDNGFERYIETAVTMDMILYWDKQKSQELFSVLGLQLPKGLNNLDSNTIIHQSRNIVKGKQEISPEKVDTYSAKPEQSKTRKPTRAEQLYKDFMEMFPDMVSGAHTYERYGNAGDANEPLSVEHLGGNTYGFMTFYMQNGDLMRDPDFTFTLDHDSKTLHILEYQQDGIPIVGTLYQCVEDEHGNTDEKLLAALEQNFILNLRQAKYTDRQLTAYTDADGNRSELQEAPAPEPEPENIHDNTPELRETLNAFSEKYGLGELNVTPERYSFRLSETLADGTVLGLGELQQAEYGMPLTPETLQTALEQFANSVQKRGTEIPDLYGRKQAVQDHGGTAPLPKVQDDLPEIFYASSPSDKISDNLAALRELIRLETAAEDQRPLYDKYHTKEESQMILRRYCGWGGLPQVFDERYMQYEYQRKMLHTLLSPEDYAAAKASTMNAHYTPQVLIDAMYQAVRNMDLPRDARILEPSCGTGNFIFRLPSQFSDASIVGVELDPVTARIAAQLQRDHDNVSILHTGFEHAGLENDSFDLAIGNVPFGDYNLNDPDYVQDWRIHDAFFRKALDKVAPGGVVAFITSSGTMDKSNPKVREYLAERAELIGAVRLPNTAFADAGTKVTSDIIFLKKRETPLQPHEPKPDWCYTVPNADGLMINSYFVSNPQMLLGKMEKTTHFDMLTCSPIEGTDLKEQLTEAIRHLNAKITVQRREDAVQKRRGQIAPWGRNFCFHVKDGSVYYRQDQTMSEVKCSPAEKKQLVQLCELRTIARELIDMQKTSVSDETLLPLREKLNETYDTYREQYGVLSSSSVKKRFGDDSDHPILQSLEQPMQDANGKITYQKADIFFRRTVNPLMEITSAADEEEALQISLDRKGKPDIPYMAVLLQKDADAVCSTLLEKGAIFVDPEKQIPDEPYSSIVERSEYLSGNVRRKLTFAEESAKTDPAFQRNVAALSQVIPEDIKANEISIRMGCTWIDPEDYTKFLLHLSGRPEHARRCDVTYSPVTGEYTILKAGSQKDLNYNETTTYGTQDYNMYQLAEKVLNQRRIVVQREVTHPTDPAKVIHRTDAKATKIAHDKAKQIEEAFRKWIFDEPQRAAKYERRYNDIFNSLVGREYDGAKLSFSGMANDFTLREHQKNCVARTIYGGNTLAAHVVGAGKSAVMFTSVMKKKELGLISKACVVVPKALTEQTAMEWRKLYPDARLLTVTNDDLSSEAKRNLFTARVATGSYDAVIMSQEQFEKIPMSKAYRAAFMQKELDHLEDMLRERKIETAGKRDYSVKAIERAKKQLQTRIEKLTDPKSASKAKDDLLEFEQLGFDYLVCDEAHAYKNGFVTTKMTNVAGVTTRPSGRAEDMQMKTDYFNEQLGQGHILFCTGTPVSNTLTELYVMMRYLRPDLLREAGVEKFDDWAATFGDVVTKNQQAADGTLKLRTSFAKFANLPELMAMYKEFADVQSADKLHLLRPELKTGKPQIISVKATPEQRAYVHELAARSKAIADGAVDPRSDNMLKITSEARLVGLGNMAIRSLYAKRGEDVPDDFMDGGESKVDKCIENVASIYQAHREDKAVQIIFSDIAVNADNGSFSVYDHIKKKLTEDYSIPEDEIIFAPKADSKERENIFRDINEGKYRVVIASTGTLGTGANIQQNLYALHHIDVPWKPSDFEQREGRILRQGNHFPEVEIINYVTEGTLDSYLYQTVTAKARFIAQLLDDKAPARVSEDCDEKVLTFGEIQAAAEGNPDFRRRIELNNEVAELTMLHTEFLHETAAAIRKTETLPEQINERQDLLSRIRNDKAAAEQITDLVLTMPDGKRYTEKKDINEKLLQYVQQQMKQPDKPLPPAELNGFKVTVQVGADRTDCYFTVKRENMYTCPAGTTENQDNATRLKNVFENSIPKAEVSVVHSIQALGLDLEQAKQRSEETSPHEMELIKAKEELEKLEEKLAGLSVQEDEILDPEDAASPVTETKAEKTERETLLKDADDDDVKPFEKTEEPPDVPRAR